MVMKDYTGPTSGRITIKGDEVIRRETFTDRPLAKDEARAVAWFTELSPHKQLREVRRLKWNLDMAETTVEADKRIITEQRMEIARLRAQLARVIPDGFAVPFAARELLDHAKAHGWKSDHAWSVDDDDPSVATLRITLVHGLYAFDHLIWACDYHGGGRMTGHGIARAPRRDWHDAPSLKRIRKIIEEAE